MARLFYIQQAETDCLKGITSAIWDELWYVQGYQIWHYQRKFTPFCYGSLRPGENADSTKILSQFIAGGEDFDPSLFFCERSYHVKERDQQILRNSICSPQFEHKAFRMENFQV